MQNSNWGAMVNRTAVCTFRNGSGIKLVAGLIVCCTLSKSLSRVGCEMGRKSTWADSLASYTLWWSVAIAHCAHLANSYLSWKESLLLAFVFYVFDNRAPMSMCSPWVVSLLAELGGGTLLVGTSLQIPNSNAVAIDMVSAPRSTGLRDVLYTTGHKLPNPFCPSHICPYCSTVCYPMTPGSSLTRPKKAVILCPAPRQQGHNITILTSSTNTRPTETSSLTCI